MKQRSYLIILQNLTRAYLVAANKGLEIVLFSLKCCALEHFEIFLMTKTDKINGSTFFVTMTDLIVTAPIFTPKWKKPREWVPSEVLSFCVTSIRLFVIINTVLLSY